MPRRVCAAVVCGLFLSSSALIVAELPVANRAAGRRAEVERLLDQPLDWSIGERQTVTIEEFVAHVKDRHKLEIRWDAAAFMLMEGDGGAAFSDVLEGLLGSIGRKSQVVATKGTDPFGISFVSSPPEVRQSGSSPASAEELTISVTLAPDLQSASLEPLPPASPTAPVAPAPFAPLPAGAVPACPACAAPKALAKPASAIAMEEPAADVSVCQHLAKRPIPVSSLSLEQATVREALEQFLDAALPPIFAGVVSTHSMTLDYVVEGHAIAITTRLRANATKETRVYRVSQITGVKPAELSRVVTHSIRPWSWRDQSTEIAERLAVHLPRGKGLTLPTFAFGPTTLGNLGIEGVTLAGGTDAQQADPGLQPVPAPLAPGAATNVISDEDLSAAAQLFSGGAIALYQATVAAIEIIHHGDPPTGVIEVLPGMLVITQSQRAHREIAELLEQLSDPVEPQ